MNYLWLYFFMILGLITYVMWEEVDVQKVKRKKRKYKSKAAWKFWYRNVYLNSPHWHRVRKKALERDGYKCRRCGSHDRLQVHHLTYTFITVEHRHMSCLQTLCERCHRREHGL